MQKYLILIYANTIFKSVIPWVKEIKKCMYELEEAVFKYRSKLLLHNDF